ncbi:unnamed protein product [Nezara viridula]|uniref:Uncharacterized protein n=1 Tax=Nezara viridula TaxID=85310 RepID=A0A9P0GW24_NEZVI|nr:unnamed protein product [Nezara viridula]
MGPIAGHKPMYLGKDLCRRGRSNPFFFFGTTMIRVGEGVLSVEDQALSGMSPIVGHKPRYLAFAIVWPTLLIRRMVLVIAGMTRKYHA